MLEKLRLRAGMLSREQRIFSSSILNRLYILIRCLIAKIYYPEEDVHKESWHIMNMKNAFQMYETLDLKKRDSNRVIVCITETTKNAGLADRIRTMCTAYVLAAESGKRFFIYHDKGFKLEDYLLPNKVDWRIGFHAISKGLNKVQFMFFLKKFRLPSKFRECHIYASGNIIDNGFLPDNLKDKYSDHSVFTELFKFHPRVEDYAIRTMNQANLLPDEYVAVHIRFLNFFESVEIGNLPHGSEKDQQEMVVSLRKTFELIYQETGKKIVLFSDSNTFLGIKHPHFVNVLPGVVGHVIKNNGNDDVTRKAFSDLYIISKAYSVYSIVGDNIYDPGFCANGFARLGAYIGNKPFVRYHRIAQK